VILKLEMLHLMAQHGLSFGQTVHLVRDRLSLQGLLALSLRIGMGRSVAAPLPHHRAYGSVARRFVGSSGSGRHGRQAERGQIGVRERDVEGRAGSDPAIDGQAATDPIHEMGRVSRPRRGRARCLQEIDWFNHRRLLEPIGNLPPAEAEAAFYDPLENEPVAASDSNPQASGKSGSVHFRSDRIDCAQPTPMIAA